MLLLLQAKSMQQKQTWCQEIKTLMIESCERCIPDRAKELVLGTKHTDDRLAGSRNKNRTMTLDSSMYRLVTDGLAGATKADVRRTIKLANFVCQ